MLNISYKDRMRDQTKVMDIIEIIKNRNWTWTGHISRRTGNRWSVALTVLTPKRVAKEIEEDNEKSGEMDYK